MPLPRCSRRTTKQETHHASGSSSRMRARARSRLSQEASTAAPRASSRPRRHGSRPTDRPEDLLAGSHVAARPGSWARGADESVDTSTRRGSSPAGRRPVRAVAISQQSPAPHAPWSSVRIPPAAPARLGRRGWSVGRERAPAWWQPLVSLGYVPLTCADAGSSVERRWLFSDVVRTICGLNRPSTQQARTGTATVTTRDASTHCGPTKEEPTAPRHRPSRPSTEHHYLAHTWAPRSLSGWMALDEMLTRTRD
jgi:hypothetical protein